MKKLKLKLNKQVIEKLDNEVLKNVKGGEDQQFLSIFHCSYTPSCVGYCNGGFTYTCHFTG